MLYHLSLYPNLVELTPRVPECAVSMYEDTMTKRVCFSDSIKGCLSALQDSPNTHYVYIPEIEIPDSDIYYPKSYEVRDAEYTHEVWLLKPVKVKCVGIVESYDYYCIDRYECDDGYVAVFQYEYKFHRNKI